MRALAARDCPALFDIIAETDSSAKDITVFWGELIAYYRDMLVVKTGVDAVKYLDLTETEAESLRSDAGLFARETLLYHSRLLDEAYLSMQRAGAIRRSVAELTLLRMADERLDTRPEALLSRIAALEAALAGGAVRIPPAESAASAESASVSTPASEAPAVGNAPASGAVASSEAPPVVRTPPKNPPKPAPAAPLRKQIRSFAEIAERVSETDKGLGGFVRKCRAYTDGDDGMILYCETQFTKNLLMRDKSLSLIAAAASAVLARPMSPLKVKVDILPADREPDDAERLDGELRSLAGLE